MTTTTAIRLAILFSLIISGISSIAQAGNDPIDRTSVSTFFQNEQYNEAVDYLVAKNAEASSDINVINDLGFAYFKAEKYQEAQKIYLKAISFDSLNFIANRHLALINKHFKDYDNELIYYQRLLRIQPSAAVLYKLTGDTYLSLKNTDTALLYYARAYHLQPKNFAIAFAFADNLADNEQYPKADSITKAFLVNDSLNVLMLRLAIRSFHQQKKMREAASLTQRWLLVNEIDPKTAVNLAQANYSISNYEACYKVCDTLLKQDVETESLLFYASQAKYKLNDFRKSNELLQQCLNLAISKNGNVYYFSRADNFEALKQYKKAVAAYDSAFYLYRDPLALYNIGTSNGCTNKD